jgi:hypothetical protein
MIYENRLGLVLKIKKILQTNLEYSKKIPIFINTRDRVSPLRQLIDWLSKAGYSNIIIIDNASTYPAMLDFLFQSPYPVLPLTRNLGHTALWQIKELQSIIHNEWFVYTDPDVIPIESCPPDVVSFLYRLLNKHSEYVKAGLGLYLSDIPDYYHLKQLVIRWEENLYGREIEPNVYEADVDTTFALYRPGTPYLLAPSLRTRGCYQARHLPWYVNSSRIDEEERYYRMHALGSITNWDTAGMNESHRILPPKGGITAKIMTDPNSFYKEIIHSKSWKVIAPLHWLGYKFGKSNSRNLKYEDMSAEQLRNEIVKIMSSKSWQLAGRIGRLKKTLLWKLSRSKSTLRGKVNDFKL